MLNFDSLKPYKSHVFFNISQNITDLERCLCHMNLFCLSEIVIPILSSATDAGQIPFRNRWITQ